MAAVQNGREALEYLQKEHIDLAFLDINLPIVSGLEILEYIDQNQLDVMSVVVSGYKNFEYARKACACHAMDYLLKPVQDSAFQALLGQIETKFVQKKQMDWEALLRDALLGKNVSRLPQEECRMLVVYGNECERMDDTPFCDVEQMWETVDLAGALHVVFPEVSTWILDGRSEMEKVVLSRDKRLVDIFAVRTLYNRLQATGHRVTILVSTASISLSQLRRAYHEARDYLYKNLLFCQPALLLYSGGPVAKPMIPEHIVSHVDNVLKKEEIFQSAEIKRNLRILLDEAVQVPMRRMEATAMFKHFFNGLCLRASSNQPYWKVEEELDFILENTFRLDEMKKQMDFLVDKSFGPMQAVTDKQGVAKAVEQYLQANYRRDISNKTLSEKFGFVPSYISSLFKAQYGVSPGEYIVRLRISQAQMLMKNSDLLTKEISQQVGYEDPFYFSKVFKRVTGETPSQYMERVREK